MTKVISIVSLKGGTGKTTVSINLGLALQELGKNTVVVDTNFNNPDVSLYLGMTFPYPNINYAIYNDIPLQNIILRHKSGLNVIANNMKFDSPTPLLLAEYLLGLEGTFDVALLDTSPNLDEHLKVSIKNSDYIILLTTPDLVSMTQTLKAIHTFMAEGKKILGVILNKVKKDKIDYSSYHVSNFLNIAVLGEIPFDDKVRVANKLHTPVLYSYPNTKFSIAIKKIASELCGKEYKRKSFLNKLLGE